MVDERTIGYPESHIDKAGVESGTEKTQIFQ